MKAIVCEMCSSNDIVKQDGYYVCQNCGTKYTPEDAKKMMVEVEGKVNVSGSAVKIDSSDMLNNYRRLARRARDSGDIANAAKYYEMVAIQDPNDWEAAFFSIYFQAAGTNIRGIESAANRVTNSLEPVCKLALTNQIMSKDESGKAAARLMAGYIKSLCEAFVGSANSHYSKFSTVDGAASEQHNRIFASYKMVYQMAVCAHAYFKDSALASELYMFCYNGSYIDKAVLRKNISKVDPSAAARLDHEEAKKAELIKAQRQAGNGWRILVFVFVLGGSLLGVIAASLGWSNPYLYILIGIILGIVCAVLGSKRIENERQKIIQKYEQEANNSQSEEKQTENNESNKELKEEYNTDNPSPMVSATLPRLPDADQLITLDNMLEKGVITQEEYDRSQLTKLDNLLEKGMITQEEYDSRKKTLLGK